MMYNGKVKRVEMIRELRSTHALQAAEQQLLDDEKQATMLLQQQQQSQQLKVIENGMFSLIAIVYTKVTSLGVVEASMSGVRQW